jgi:hypothetical protein
MVDGVIWLVGYGVLVLHFALLGLLIAFLVGKWALTNITASGNIVVFFVALVALAMVCGLLGVRLLHLCEAHLRKRGKEKPWAILGRVGFYGLLVPEALIFIAGKVLGKW